LEKGTAPETESYIRKKTTVLSYHFHYTFSGEKECLPKNWTAFCGIAKPKGFRHALETLNLHPGTFIYFRDHIHYTPSRLRKLEKTGNTDFVTTLKDYVKLPDHFKNKYPIHTITVELIIDDSFESYLLQDLL